jgi:hypothetical protein
MLDQLLEVVRSKAQEQIVDNSAIDNKFNNDAMQEAANTIKNTLQDQLAQGNVKDVLNIFNSKTTNEGNPLIGMITDLFSKQLGSKFGVEGNKASSMAASMIPSIIDQFVKKTNDNNDSSIDINDIFSSLAGKGVSGIDFKDILGKLGKDSDGFGLDDVIGMVSKGAGAQKGSGDLLGSLGGLLGK